ncbi:MAG: hypothetical protein DRQ88_06910 [Epsilonproteobacteria bacterium]|nr:MAG: hypothetical protein DRQ89_05680 [Campylobacterota bacterium]RLA66365.1 MAG: hypothetical protein DRQ88_06910 [Campylobacterota bacterium]
MKNFTLFFIAIFTFLQTSFATTINPGAGLRDPQIIGGVYNSKLDFFDPGVRCIEVDEKNDIRRVFNNEGRVNYNENSDQTTLVKKFGFSFGFELKPPTGESYGFGMEFLNTFTDVRVNSLAVYKTTVFMGSEILEGPSKLTEEARELSKTNPHLFEQVCGDEFVTRINKGGEGTVTVKVEAEGIENSNEFNADWSIGMMDIGTFEAAISKLKKLTELKIKLSVSGTQRGGFPARINSIFGLGTGVASCVIAKLEGCKVLISNIVTYFSRTFVEQFDPYFRDASGSGVINLPVTAAPLSYVTTSYCKLSPGQRPVHLDCDDDLDTSLQFKVLEEKRNQVLDEVKKIQDFARESKLLLAPDFFKLIKMYTFRMKQNLQYIKDAKVSCFRDKWSCESEVKHFLKRYYPLQSEIVPFIKNDERVQFCFKSGKNVDISGLEIRTVTDNKPSKSFKLYAGPSSSEMDCFMFWASELNREELDGLQIRVKTMGEDKEECKLRSKKKFSSWADWDLRSVTVKHFKSGYTKTFAGKNFRQKNKCRKSQDSRYYLRWESLKPLR